AAGNRPGPFASWLAPGGRRRPDVPTCAPSRLGSRRVSVSCEKFRSKTSLDRDHLTGGDMEQRISALAALLLIIPARQQAQQPLAPVDWKLVDAGLGKSGALQPDGAYKVGMPASDL